MAKLEFNCPMCTGAVETSLDMAGEVQPAVRIHDEPDPEPDEIRAG